MPRDLSMQTLCLGVAWLAGLLCAAGQDRVIVQPAAPAVSSAIADQAAWREAILKGEAAKARQLLAARPSLAFGSDSPGKGWLHLAADLGHEEVVALLIGAKADVNAPGDRLMSAGSMETPLHLAARNGHAGIVRRLLGAGANVNARQFSQNTPLHLALQPWEHHRGVEQLASRQETNRTGRVETIRLLCLAGADLFALNRFPNRSNSPVQAASTPGHEQWLDILLTNARPRNVRAPDGRSLLDLARHHERLEAMLALALPEPVAPAGQLNPLQALVWHGAPGPRQADGARLEPRRYWELVAAGQAPDLFTRIGLEDVAGVKDWLRANPGQLARLRDAEGRSPLHWAVTKSCPELAELLLEHGAEPAALDASGRTPLLIAVETGQLEMVQKLKTLAQRALRDDTFPLGPLELALVKGHGAMVDALLELQPNVNRPCLTGGTLLHLAARKSSVSVTERLLALGANPKLRDHRERTPLHLAVTSGNGLQVDALLKGGAPLDATDEAGRLPLHEAARLGYAELLPRLLPPAALVHQPDKAGRTPLELALLAGHEGAAEFLLSQKPGLNRHGPGGMTLLHLAAQSGRADFAARLLAAGADAAATDERGRTPLHAAAERGHTDALIKLVSARAPLTIRDRDGKTALELALAGGHTPAMRVLLQLDDWKPDATARQTTPLHTAAAAGSLALVQELAALSPTPDLLDERGQTPLVLAAMNHHFALVQLLVERGASINATNAAGQTPVLSAMLRQNYSLVIALQRLGANLNLADTNGNTALHHAATHNRSDGVGSTWLLEFDRLIATSALPTNLTFSAWLRGTNTLATIEQRIATLRRDGGHFDFNSPAGESIWQEQWKFVLAAGADARVTNQFGQTPLHIMASSLSEYAHTSRVEVAVAEFVRRGTDLKVRDGQGHTALHEAAQRGRWQVVQALLRHGAEPDARTHEGFAAMHLALQAPWRVIVQDIHSALQALAQHGANLNARDANGQTVLHHFSRFGRDDIDRWNGPMVAEFLKLKPDVNAPDKQGDTPLHLAVRAGRPQLANLLNSHGANPLLRNKAGESPLELSAKAAGPPWQKPNLLPSGARADPLAAASTGDLESLKVWFALDPNPIVLTNSATNPLLTEAARNHHTNVVDFLLAKGAKPNPFVALHMGRLTLLAELLREEPRAAGAQWHHATRFYHTVTPTGTSSGSSSGALAPLLHHAVSVGSEEAVALILARSPNVNAADSDGFTALYHALTNQAAAVAARLRSSGALENAFDLIAQNKLEQLKPLAAHALAVAATNRARPNPLIFAMRQANPGAVNILLAAGADPNTPWLPGYGMNPSAAPPNPPRLLHVAVAREQADIARALLDHGANVKAADSTGLTPLHLAAWRGQTSLITLLLNRGADPNASLEADEISLRRPPSFRPTGHTPLHLAALFLQTNSITLLVRAGADLERPNLHAQTPLGLLRARGAPGISISPLMMMGTATPLPRWVTMGMQGQPPARSAPRDEVILLLRRLGAKEPVTGEGVGNPPFGPPRPSSPPPAPSAKAAPIPVAPAKQP